MNQPSPSNSIAQANPVELTAAAVSHLVRKLPSGTAYCIGIVLIVMMTGRLVESKGSWARAVLPFVFHPFMGMASSRKGNGKGKSAVR